MHRALIGLGANLGQRERTLELAVARLNQSAGQVIACSSWRETAPVGGPGGQQPFLNGAVTLDTSVAPQELLGRLQEVEKQLGRQPAERWAARMVDLDLLLYDDRALDTPDLKLPHPRMAFRRFVLEPAAEIAGEMIHPPTGWTLARLLEHLVAATPYLAIAGVPEVGTTRLAERLCQQSGGRLIHDPALHEQDETDRIALRASLLDRAAWPSDRWTISDFWFDQSLAWASMQDDKKCQVAVEEEWRKRCASVMPPKLLAVLEPGSQTRTAALGTPEALDRYFKAIRLLTTRPDQGPVVWLSADALDDAATELLAAMQAMR